MSSMLFSPTDQSTLEKIMMHRRDIRGNNFVADEITEHEVQTILNAAVLAPSVGFSQPWEFVVIKDNNVRKAVYNSYKEENQKAQSQFEGDKQDLYCNLKLEGILEAPVNIAVLYKPSEGPVLGQTSMPAMGEYSVVCAIQNMWLMARALNIGVGWVSILDPEKVKAIVRAPQDRVLVAYLCVGRVKAFSDTPELEKLNWEKRKQMQSLIYQNEYSPEACLD